MKTFAVYMVKGAKQDLIGLHHYISLNESREKADRLIDDIERACAKLKTIPHRGRIVPELERLGMRREFRELIFGPYRIIYTVRKSEVFVYCVLDGRRDLQDLLQERLLR